MSFGSLDRILALRSVEKVQGKTHHRKSKFCSVVPFHFVFFDKIAFSECESACRRPIESNVFGEQIKGWTVTHASQACVGYSYCFLEIKQIASQVHMTSADDMDGRQTKKHLVWRK